MMFGGVDDMMFGGVVDEVRYLHTGGEILVAVEERSQPGPSYILFEVKG